MTHDELVDIAIVKDLNKLIRKQMKAIDAVFELHKPSECSHGIGCLECGGMECATGYPCPTIQKIVENLE